MSTVPDLRLPPHSIESEQAVLGGLLLDARAWDNVGDLLSDADFFSDQHRRIWRHMALAFERGQAVDAVTVAERIEAAGETEQTGGLAYLGDLAVNTPSAANIRRYAEIVRERSVLRRLQAVAVTLQESCSNHGGRSPEELAGEAEAAMIEAIDRHADDPSALGDAFVDALAYIDDRGETGGLATGFKDFDAMTGGLEPGQLVIVAARPSVGKTIAACCIADYVARQGGAVIFHTLEMSRREIGMRILAARSGVPVHAMRSGIKNQEDWGRMSNQIPDANRQRFWIDDTPAVSVAQVRARARRLKRKGGLSLVLIDYLQLMRGRGDNRIQEIGSISRGLKTLAKELGVPVIALAQLNRAVESRPDKRPMSSDLRDSGEIEQDADIVAMLHRESLYSDAPEWDGIAELILRKNRNGPLGEVMLSYLPEQMRFADYFGPNVRRQMTERAGQSRTRQKGFE